MNDKRAANELGLRSARQPTKRGIRLLVKLAQCKTFFFQRGSDFLTLYKFRCDQKRIVIRACVLTHSVTEIMLGQATTESGFKDHYIKRVLGLKDLWLSKIVETRQS